MFDSCLQKQMMIKELFLTCSTDEAKYQMIIELGRKQPRLDSAYKIPENVVQGCQSIMYLHTICKNNIVTFQAESDALISQGLATLLIEVYSGESPEVILKCPPTYLEELGIPHILTPSRSNGLYSVHLRMKQEALRCLVHKNK